MAGRSGEEDLTGFQNVSGLGENASEEDLTGSGEEDLTGLQDLSGLEAGEGEEALVIFMPSGRRGRVARGQTVLEAAQALGVAIESICGGRLTCNKCRVRVEEGRFEKHGIVSAAGHLSPAADDEVALLAALGSPEMRLSCVARVEGDALLFVPEESRGQKQVIRKAAGEQVIALEPAVRQVTVVVEAAQLGEHRGDWGRLQDALREQWQIEARRIDLPALRRLQGALREGGWKVTVTVWQDEVIAVQPGYVEASYGLAVDIGSTTVAAYLCDLRTGALLATEAAMNPQVTYGEDLMSRISYVMSHRDGLEKMHEAIIETLNRLAAAAARQAGVQARQIHEVVFAGNTTMIHILLGISPVELGGAPFALSSRDALDVKARELGLRLHAGANAHVLPAQAGHVGADNVGVLLAEEPHRREEVSLTVDVGTNAEIVLGNRAWLTSASSPTGPAFEGAQITHGMRAAPGAIERVRIDPETLEARFLVIGEPRWSDEWRLGPEAAAEAQPKHLAAGICGSGIVEVVVEMFLAGIIGADGRFDLEKAGGRVRRAGRSGLYVLARAEESATGKPIVVTQNDVRAIQLAKAALYAGARLLMKRAGVERVERIALAGAFGSYIDPRYAMILGLIPDAPLDQVRAAGNAAGDGARIALLNRQRRAEAGALARRVRYLETAVDPDFQEEFVAALDLPHARDAFPHLEGMLPERREAPRRKRRRG
jgi:uncharacterized 2Fe-2S/4Fe-4S cluster protein (DUF4445 family)